jgi:hypothetical protein
MTDRDLKARLVALGLIATAAHLDDIIALATKKRCGPAELFELASLVEVPAYQRLLAAAALKVLS